MVKNLPVNAGDIIRDACSIPGSGTSPGEGNANPLQYCLKNPMDRGAKQAIVQGVAKESDMTVTEQQHKLVNWLARTKALVCRNF